MIQYIAADDARGDTMEAWVRTQAFFETIGEDELLDTELASDKLLFRLFHEDGVRCVRLQAAPRLLPLQPGPHRDGA